MNKNLFLGMFAATGMLLATSCSNDELGLTQSGNEAQVSFSLGLEGGIATRAISDGKSADVLMYAVFDKDGNRITTIDKVEKTGVTFPTTENITLAKGQTYKVAFWAQDDDCEAYTVSDDMQVTVDYETNNTSNNDETRDAFFKTVEFTVTGSTSIDVELKRPFAQINVGVTKQDWEEAVASGITIAQSSVVIKNAATNLNLLDGTVSGEAEVSYELANIPANPAILEVDVDGDGTKEEYNWLSMSYILPADNTTGYAKTTLDNVAFVFAPENNSYSKIELNQGLNAVPVQRNWRTNILGKLLTGNITFNIVVDPVYEDDHNIIAPYATINGVEYKSFAEAMEAVQDGETIKLEGETTLEGVANSKLFSVDKNITIDLNGYGFVANMPDVTVSSSIFEVVNGGELTIIGEGNVKFVTKSAPNNVAAFINNLGGIVNLKGGNWTISEVGGYALLPTFVDNNSNTSSVTLNIYGGTYTFHRNLFRNFANAASHNGYATVATMNIYGGTFNGRESDAGAIWNQKPAATVPDGAGVINVMGGTFNNVVINDEFAGVVYVESQEEFDNALANVNTHTINLGVGTYVADIYNGTPGRKSLTIIGSEGTKFGHTATTGGQLRLDLFDSFTIRNCEIIQRSGVKTWGHIVFGSGNKATGVYTIENCKFNGVGTQGIYINENTTGATYNILNCTFDGDFGTEGAITIQTNKNVNHIVNVKGCTFNNIPDTSHRIFLAKSTAGLFYDFTLNTDLQVSSNAEVIDLIKLGVEKINLSAGNYDMTQLGDLRGKTLTLVGTKNAVIDASAVDARNQFVTGATLAFEGVTLNFSNNNYMGFANAAGLTYKNCDINGLQFLFNDTKFENCNLNSNGAEHCVWTYSANNVSFEGCEFTYADRCVNVYVDNGNGSVDVAFEGCKFASSNTASVGAVEINSSAFPQGANVEFNGCTAPANGHMVFISKWDSATGTYAIVKVDGYVITAPVQQ